MSLKAPVLASDPPSGPLREGDSGRREPPARAPVGTVSTSVLTVVILVVAGISVAATATYFKMAQGPPHSPGTNATAVDDAGRKVSVPGPPTRIVSLEPSATDILIRLGLRDRLAGVDCNAASAGGILGDYTPQQVSNWGLTGVRCVIAYPSLDLSGVYALSPSLIIGGPFTTVSTLDTITSQAGIPTVYLNPSTLVGIAYDVQIVARLTGTVSTGQSIIQSMANSLNSDQTVLQNATVVPSVLLTYFVDPNGYWTFGVGSFGNDLLTLCGTRSVTANSSVAYPEVSSAFVLASNPYVVIIGLGFGLNASFYASNGPQWSDIPAVQSKHVLPIDVTLLTEPDPSMVFGLKSLLLALHPELGGGTPF